VHLEDSVCHRLTMYACAEASSKRAKVATPETTEEAPVHEAEVVAMDQAEESAGAEGHAAGATEGPAA
jgi:hypothetical protein